MIELWIVRFLVLFIGIPAIYIGDRQMLTSTAIILVYHQHLVFKNRVTK